MAALGEDRYKRLRSVVDSWAAEVSEVRSVLAGRLKVEVNAARPAFRLHRERGVSARAAPSPVDAQSILDAHARAAEMGREKQRIESELAFAREQLLAISRDGIEQRQRADEKSGQLEEMARALGRARLDLNDTLEQLRAREWALIQSGNENTDLRGNAGLAAIPRTVPVDDYDAVVESHMSIRAEAASLQERVIRREHEIFALRGELGAARTELAAWESMGPTSGAGIARLAGVIAERSAALEQIEGTAQGQELLIGALRQELDAARAEIERREFDHERIGHALRQEMESLRAVSIERDFVVAHQAQSVETFSMRESELKAELNESRQVCESLRLRARQAADEEEAQRRELQMLRARMAERESEVWRLRSAPPAAAGEEPGLAQLQAALATRDGELSRARARIAFLRGQGRESAGLTAMAEVFASEPPAAAGSAQGLAGGASMAIDGIQVKSNLQREVEKALAAEYPWHLVGVVGGMAGLGLLTLGVLTLILA